MVCLHSPLDKHGTHVALLCRCVAALSAQPEETRPPGRVFGCEAWRSLDWVHDDLKAALPTGARPNLQAALNGVFDSQISGGNRCDLAVMGRRAASAFFHESQAVDSGTGLTFAVGLTSCCREGGPSLGEFTAALINSVERDATSRLAKLARFEFA